MGDGSKKTTEHCPKNQYPCGSPGTICAYRALRIHADLSLDRSESIRSKPRTYTRMLTKPRSDHHHKYHAYRQALGDAGH